MKGATGKIGLHLPMYQRKGTVDLSSLNQKIQELVDHDGFYLVDQADKALRASLLAAGLGPGMDVLVPAFGIDNPGPDVASVGARPCYVDVGQDIVLDPDKLWEKLRQEYRKTQEGWVHKRRGSLLRAVIMTHPLGYSPFVDDMEDFAKEHGLLLVDDGRGSLGSKCWSTKRGNWISPGAAGDIGVVSDQGVQLVRAEDQTHLHLALAASPLISDTRISEARSYLEHFRVYTCSNARLRRNLFKVLSDAKIGQTLPAPVWSEPAVPMALVMTEKKLETAEQLEDMGFTVETEFWPNRVLGQTKQFSYRRGKCPESEIAANHTLAVGAGRMSLQEDER